MARARKTFEVAELLRLVNLLVDPASDNFRLHEQWVKNLTEREGYTPQQIARHTLEGLLERILHETGNYNGFQFITREGERDLGGGRSVFEDKTARRYY